MLFRSAAYGVDADPTDEFARQCLLGRRCLEAGVRFVQVNFSYPRNYWDAHGDLRNNHTTNARKVDRPVAALLADLKDRGLLDDTLVVFGTEFGRTPKINPTGGRDHWPACWTVYFAGGGVKGGRVVGKSDEIGGYPAERPVKAGEVVATIFHSLGLDLETHLPGPQARPLDADVVLNRHALLRPHGFRFAINLASPVPEMQFNAMLLIPVAPREHEFLGIAMSKEGRQSNSVISRARLFAERDDPPFRARVEFNELLAEALPDHSVADDDNRLALTRRSHRNRSVRDHA